MSSKYYYLERYKLKENTMSAEQTTNKPTVTNANKTSAPVPTESQPKQTVTQAERVGEGKITKEAAIKYLQEVRDYLIKFEGKPGFNPHFQLNKMDKVAKKLEAVTVTDAVINEAMAFAKVEPKV